MTNTALRIAVVQSGKEQREIAALARMHETRLSSIIRGRLKPYEGERLRISGVLQRPVGELFPETDPQP